VECNFHATLAIFFILEVVWILYDIFDQYNNGDNNILCIIIHSLKTENHKSLPAVASMVNKETKPCTAQAC